MSMIKLAEAQLTGFAHGSKGFSVTDLAKSMNLTKKEWEKLRLNSGLKQSDVDDLDALFNISA